MLTGLTPTARWRETTLEFDSTDDVELTLDGTGITLLVFDRLFRSHSGNVIESHVAPFVVGMDCGSSPVSATSLRATPFG
ncbi:hypothetical protein ACFZBU_43650 [Embleya sp. NPDC008237]|uniref:hypothetical protein n=1 Tax=Embleya sp. NPDC008237 TaxID=3363978 RepID=UPI0036E5DC08